MAAKEAGLLKILTLPGDTDARPAKPLMDASRLLVSIRSSPDTVPSA